jgi:preprotein translocase subunit SecF
MKLLKLVPDNTNLDFMRWRNVGLMLSIILTVASLSLVAVRGLNLGVDFVGGQMIRVTFAKQVDVEKLRNDVGSINVGDASIQETGGPRSYQIRLPKPEGGEAAANRAASQVRSMLQQRYPGARVDSVETVSGKVSEELAWDGSLAIGLAMLGIAIYIWFRFEWQFGVGALITLFHDVAMTLGFFSLTQLQVDLNVVAAILTIVGYSLNDTVVIYDRIRENLRKFRKMSIVPLLNLSLNETLSRDDGHVAVDPSRTGHAPPARPGGHLRPDDRDLHRNLRRHLFLDLHLLAGAGLAGRKADSFLRTEDEEKAAGPAAV